MHGSELTLIPLIGGLYGSQFLVGKLFEVHKGYENETTSIPQVFFMLIHNLFSKLVGNHLFYHFFIQELPKSESVCSMYPRGVGTTASFTKICCD